MENTDPYYNRKPVPDQFTEHVGPTGLTKAEEALTRERKYSKDGGDVRKFSNPKGANGTLDPHYARKQVPDELIRGVGETGLTPEQEFLNREKKYLKDGVDVRRFSNSKKGGMAPQDDPYYGRKSVAAPQISGVGDTGYSKAEEYEVRERKQSMFQESADPFQQLSGTGHRQSISGVASGGAAEARRRSSAVAPHVQQAQQNHELSSHQPASHSGFAGETLAAIDSRTEPAPPTTNATASTGNHGLVHDVVTNDTDDVAPHELR